MAAELGQTTDPKALIPGEPEAIASDLRDLTGNLQRMQTVAQGLQGVDPGSWTGQAADDFRTVFGQEPENWAQAVSSAGQNAQALSDYGSVLAWGQGQAQTAIEMFAQAQAASRAAAASYNAAAQTAAAAGQTMAPFHDPGQGPAQAAQKVLDDARGKVGLVGDAVAKALGFTKKSDGTYTKDLGDIDGTVGKDGSASFGSQSGSLLGDKVDSVLNELGINTTVTSGASSGSTDVLDGKTDGSFSDADGISGTGKADGSLLGADASASGSIGWLGMTGSATGDAYLAKGDASGQLNLGKDADLAGQAEGEVGATGSASGSLGVTGIQGSAQAFAGAKVSASGSADVAGVTAGGTAEGWAGVGATASAQLGMGSDGKFHIGASIGVALGLGGKLGVNLTIDPKQVESTVSDVAGDIGHVASETGSAIANTASGAVHDAESLGSKALNFLGL